jgi:hypothetical protein
MICYVMLFVLFVLTITIPRSILPRRLYISFDAVPRMDYNMLEHDQHTHLPLVGQLWELISLVPILSGRAFLALARYATRSNLPHGQGKLHHCFGQLFLAFGTLLGQFWITPSHRACFSDIAVVSHFKLIFVMMGQCIFMNISQPRESHSVS